jgi:two-component system chemotaxis sensor kinase CheA
VTLPVSTLAEAFPKIIRDLARAKGKEIEVAMRGEELGIDKRVLEEMKDPMIHLLRNCVDHGMQTPQERAAQGKAPCGRISLEFTAMGGGQVEILVSDDGAGIDPEKVRAAAVKAGVISRETAQTLGPEESLALIFQSGVSTSPIITDLSGRGLGLAIVREKAEKLGGTVSVETRIGAGATFRLLLPLNLATFRGVILRVEGRFFVLPSIGIERVLRIDKSEIKSVENREIVRVDGRALPLARLAEVLGLPRREGREPEAAAESSSASEREYLIVLASADKRIAFQADEIIEERQIMVKSLSKELQGLPNVAGATILGNGSVVPVLSVSDLLKSAALAPVRTAADNGKAAAKKARILVAEDSITARMLLKNILETAGYAVTTAVDGADAFFQAVNGAFDVVVSDVDMPRMSGFELCAKIRSEARLAPLPVVLVTALESRDDRERGIEAGANAYIVKSAFDQGNLLEIVARLL